MNRSERGAAAAGIVVFVVSALCAAALIVQFFDFGAADAHRNFLVAFGRSLFDSYGFSSFLIPLYAFIAGITILASGHSKRQAFYLLSSLIPFFTVAGVEFFTEKVLPGVTPTVRIIRSSTFLLVSALLCIIEYIAIGLAADFILGITENKLSGSQIGMQNWYKDVLKQAAKRRRTPFSFDIKSLPPSPISSLRDYVVPEVPLYSNTAATAHDAETEKPVHVAPEPLHEKAASFVQTEIKTQSAAAAIPPLQAIGYTPFAESAAAEPDAADKTAVLTQAEPSLYADKEPGVLCAAPDKSAFLTRPFEFELIEDEEDGDAAESTEAESSAVFFARQPADELESDADGLPDDASDFSVESAPVAHIQKPRNYAVPAEGLLTSYPGGDYWVIDSETERAAQALKDTLNEFKIEAEVTGIRKGPVVTMFEILPAPGVKLSKIVALGDNIALRLAASSVRIVAPIPGKHAVGIEVPNKERAIVGFKELIDTDIPAFKKMAIPMVLGKDISGEVQVLDLAKTPHLLIAGSTGSGKSVCVNTLILSILYKRPPQDVRMILIDPKIVELKLYNDIPHLLTPVITEPKKAFQALQYCLCEMERRYALLDGMGVREITSYNKRIVERRIAAEKLPYIVLIIDEFADLMATTGKELESTVARLAAMSRAVGIHLVLATQRPSIDVITGLIKANIPSRIAFMVASKMDSRIIIDQVGAEKLLGKGDMLYASATDPFPIRIQGTFVSDTEVENVVEYVKQYGEPDYIDDEIFVDDEDTGAEPGMFSDGEDPLYEKALEIVMQAGKASASYIQRRLKIGYNRAARLVEDMEARGIVGPANGSKPREVIHAV